MVSKASIGTGTNSIEIIPSKQILIYLILFNLLIIFLKEKLYWISDK